MSIDTLDHTPPPLFKQGPSALSRLLFFSVLALLLMVADAGLHLMQPLRAAIATVLYPAQWLALQPVQMTGTFASYLTDLKSARATEEAARRQLVEQSQRAGQVEPLQLENQRLRELLGLRERVQAAGVAAQVLYDATDPYSRRVVIDKGLLQGITAGSPVLDESGVLGQITRAYPFVSEITLLVDRDQVIPVMNARTGTRGVAYGDPSPHGGMMELRYISVNEDVKEGDLLTTSGIDGVYPPGLQVARVAQVDRRTDSSFARIQCAPVAQWQSVMYVMVLAPVVPQPGAIAAAQADAPASSAASAPSSAALPASTASAARRARRGARP
ncbi:MAG: rod shape-determining protein MreC [Desulfovibrionaceae bacterium]|jgi:rod shape-determining protein MreC|nr:rod shape-determining protein MreC [Desulfovibrionaceae bacterium]